MRVCPKCGQSKPETDFPSNPRSHKDCKRCIADYAKGWRVRHAQRINKEKRETYAQRYQNDPAVQEGYWRRYIKRLYGMTPEEFESMLAAQGGVCAICGREERATRGHNGNKQLRRLAIDHCHSTGQVRGLLCSRCNIVLGWIENKELYAKLLKYLHKSP